MEPRGELPRFRDLSSELDRFGLSDPFSRQQLPGMGWEAGYMFDTMTFMPNCNMEDGVFNDTVWSYGSPDRLRVYESEEDRVLVELFYSDAIRRLQAVEQLTLPPQYSTIPNTGAFSRFEHIWGSVLLTRQMTKKYGIKGREAVELQLRTLVSDIAHTFGSHLGDWLFQGVGGTEDQHDIELEAYLEAVGINDILRKYGYEPKDIIFPAMNDWIEAKSPDLCVDRVDYGLREMNRWNDVVQLQAFSAADFVLTPERLLAMKDQRRARIFAEGYLLLSQEHWSEPTHQFLEDMLILRTKLFYAQGKAPNHWGFYSNENSGLVPLHDIHPRDLMYVTDPGQMSAYALPDLGGHTIDAIMRSIAQYRRQYVWEGRRMRINAYLDQFRNEEDYSEIVATGRHEPLESSKFNDYREEYPPTMPIGFAILTPEEAAAQKDGYHLDFPQTPFKVRQIDPLVQSGDSFKRLSQLDPSYAKRLKEHEAALLQPRIARISMPDPATFKLLSSIVENTEAYWQERLRTTRRMTADELRALVQVSANDIHGPYPFLGFLSF